MAGKRTKPRRYQLDGELLIAVTRHGIRDVVATTKKAPRGTAPCPAELRDDARAAIQQARAQQEAIARQKLLDHRGHAMEPVSHQRAVGALERMAQGARQHHPDSKD